MENESRANGQLPIISQKTVSKLEEDLGLNVNGTAERSLPIYTRIKELTLKVVADLVRVNPKLMKALRSGTSEIIEGSHVEGTVTRRTAAIQGMALVIKIFDIECGDNLRSRLREISDDESIKTVENISVIGLGKKQQINPIDIAFKTPKIPDAQVGLNNLLEEISRKMVFGSYFRLGASVMYDVLSEFESTLFSQQNPPASQPSPPLI